MKALTLTQPWATLVAIGAKRVETRGWSTRYRGELAIHAAKGFPEDARALLEREPFCTVLRTGLRDGRWRLINGEMPLGCIVAVTTLTDVARFSHDGMLAVPQTIGRLAADTPSVLNEIAFGNYAEGRYGFGLSNALALPEPLPCRGALGLWDVPPDVDVGVRLSLAGALT